MDPAGSSAGQSGLPAGAVAVPVPAVELPPAAAAAPAARPSWTQAMIARVTVTWVGAAGAGAVRRVAWAAALLVLGCAAAGLAFFAMTLPAADDSRLPELQGAACAPTRAEAAGLRIASQSLLLAASTQVLAATVGLVVPSRLVALFAHVLGWLTADRATDVLQMLVASCHGASADDAALISSHYRLFRDVLWAALAVGAFVSIW